MTDQPQVSLRDLEKNENAQRLKPPYRMILIYLLNGYSQVETARILGYSNKTISFVWCNNKRFKKAFEELSKERDSKATDNASRVRKLIDSASIEAQECLAELIKNDNTPPSVKHSASKTILEMAGHKAPERLEITHDKPLEIKVSDDDYDPSEDPYFKNHPDKDSILAKESARVQRELEEIENG